MHLIILAGGLATRLRPFSEKTPKALINIAGKPFIFWQLKILKTQGIKKILICCGYLGEIIKDKVGDGKRFGLDITYSFDGPFLLGTGGAIKNALNMLPDYFMVMYGDTILSVDFEQIQNNFHLLKTQNLMVVLKNNNAWAPSNVICENCKIINYSNKNDIKANYIDYGLSILSKKVFMSVKEKKFNLDLIFKNLINMKQLSSFEVYKRFYEINTIEGVKETEDYLIKNFHY